MRMEYIQNLFVGVQWVELLKSTGIWVVVFAYFIALIQATVFTVSGILSRANSTSPEEDAGFSIVVVYASILWSIFIMVNFY